MKGGEPLADYRGNRFRESPKSHGDEPDGNQWLRDIRVLLHPIVAGCVNSALEAHGGKITKGNAGSVTKRIIGQIVGRLDSIEQSIEQAGKLSKFAADSRRLDHAEQVGWITRNEMDAVIDIEDEKRGAGATE